jgi:hypothetical protein
MGQVDDAIKRGQLVAANLAVDRARLRGAMEAIYESVGLGAMDVMVQQERQTIHDRHPERLAGEGFVG